VALLLLTNAAFDFAWADHDEDKEKRWYQKIFDWDDDDMVNGGLQLKISTSQCLVGESFACSLNGFNDCNDIN